MSKSALPIIDLSKSKTNRENLAKEIVYALENVGFLYIDNVEGIDFRKLDKMCKWFFGLSKQTKMKIARKNFNPESRNVYRGYFPVVEGEPSRKEGFEIGRDVPADDKTVSSANWMYENSVWPDETELSHLNV